MVDGLCLLLHLLWEKVRDRERERKTVRINTENENNTGSFLPEKISLINISAPSSPIVSGNSPPIAPEEELLLSSVFTPGIGLILLIFAVLSTDNKAPDVVSATRDNE